MSEFAASLVDVFSAFGRVSLRRMFGGHGVFYDGLMFALVVDDELYLKADDSNRDLLIGQGSHPFTYHKKGKPVALQYYLAPEAMFDDPDDAAYWARLSFECALRQRRN